MRKSSLAFTLAALGVAAALFLLLRPPPPPRPAAVPPPSRAFSLEVRQGKLVAGPAVLRVDQGDAVSISVRSDQPDEFHLHGYDRKLQLRPGRAATLTLLSDRSGRFVYELEHAGIELGALEVQPR